MALQVWLRRGETDDYDVSLTSSGAALLSYPLTAPDINQENLLNLGDGNGLSVPSFSNVTESLTVLVQGASASAVRDKIQAIERLTDLARQGTVGIMGEKIYLVVQFDQDSEPWRSQVIAARFLTDKVPEQIWKNYTEATLILTRRYYFETVAAKTVPITTGDNGTPGSPRLIYNNPDTLAPNTQWADIAAGVIQGSLPAPAKIVLQNAGTTRQVRAVYFGNFVHIGTEGGFTPTFPASYATLAAGTWSGEFSHEIYSWPANIGYQAINFKGQFGRVLAVFNNIPEATTLLRIALQMRMPSPVVDLALGEHVLAGSNRVLDLGSIPIPPSRQYALMGELMYFTLQGNAQTPSGDNVGVDWLQLMPSGAGKYRVIRGVFDSWSVLNNDQVVDDGMEDSAFAIESANAFPVFRPFFAPLHLWPGVYQRIRTLIQGNTLMETNVPWWIYIYYRPRRLGV